MSSIVSTTQTSFVVFTEQTVRPGYLGRFEKAQSGIEKEFGLPAGSLATGITQQDFATKSAEEIQNILRASGANKYQEASRAANTFKNLYDLKKAFLQFRND